MDIWEPVAAAQRIEEEACTMTVAATPFLADPTHNPGVAQYDTSTLKTFICGGAPIPRVLMHQATEKLGIRVVSVWGMTENGITTSTRFDDPPEKVFETDGVAVPGAEVRIIDESGKVLGPHQDGLLQARGASHFVGYLKRPEINGIDEEGWFDTGDIARMDEDGYIRITGRSKDIIIRGGENVPVVEVEELLYRHPDVQDAAVVAMPDERLGERGCAFVVLKNGKHMSFQDMVGYLSESHLTKSYLPERLELLPDMPRTPSGKIQKFKLREVAKALTPMT
jgi:cyclohexanecarboxylate-CoA ligase